jgi:hypothetical protein
MKNETCPSVNELYEKEYALTLAHWLVVLPTNCEFYSLT